MPGHVLIADGDPGVLAGLAAVCRKLGWVTTEAHGGGEVLALARTEQPDVCLLDLDLEDCSSSKLLAELIARRNAPSVVFLTGLADVATAVAAMREGAADFLEKPVHRQLLEGVLERVLRNRALRSERDRLREQVALMKTGPIVGSSEAVRRMLALVERVAATSQTTVLIQGESGVGKELVARAIHESSDRASGPFVAINCAALTAELLEAELFGYEPGAFTGGSTGGHRGLIAAAEGGTLFLDEVGELELALQAKLLRVLQERTYRRVGANRDLPMDARIVAASNRDLGQRVETGHFREDLYYRINVLSIAVPPLRERREDIPELATHFLRQFGEEFKKPLNAFSQAAMARLLAHPWPGNVRELRNTIERAALLAEGSTVEPGHLGLVSEPGPQTGDGGFVADPTKDLLPLPSGNRTLRAAEEALIRRVLEETDGNRSASARLLGINRTTLYNKLRAYGIDA